MSNEKKQLLISLTLPLTLLAIIFVIHLLGVMFDIPFYYLGVYPLEWKGLHGIVTAPFVHSDWKHLFANSVPFLVLGSALFLFYRQIGLKVFFWLVILTGMWVWISGRPSYHIGASGIVNALASFLLFSGFIRRQTSLMAVALAVVFLYGSLIWGIFPDLYPNEPISWEAHLGGWVAGFVMAIYYRKEGPQKKKYSWELEEEMEEDDEPEPELEVFKPRADDQLRRD